MTIRIKGSFPFGDFYSKVAYISKREIVLIFYIARLRKIPSDVKDLAIQGRLLFQVEKRWPEYKSSMNSCTQVSARPCSAGATRCCECAGARTGSVSESGQGVEVFLVAQLLELLLQLC